MTYKDKFRDMARSVLPSTARGHAREELNLIRRAGRHRVAADLNDLSKAPLDELLDDDYEYDLGYTEQHRIKSAVYDRRDKDKVGPVMRWATERTKDMAKEDRLKWVDSKMPSNLIGQHVVYGHIAYADAFDTDEHYTWRSRTIPTREEAAEEAKRERSDALNALHVLLANNHHGGLNHAIKAAAHHGHDKSYYKMDGDKQVRVYKMDFCTRDGYCQPRLLLGAHDVADFYDAIRAPSRHWWWRTRHPAGPYYALHAEYYHAYCEFMNTIKEG